MRRRDLLRAGAAAIVASSGCIARGAPQESARAGSNNPPDRSCTLSPGASVTTTATIPDIGGDLNARVRVAITFRATNPGDSVGTGHVTIENVDTGTVLHSDTVSQPFVPGDTKFYEVATAGPVGGDEVSATFTADSGDELSWRLGITTTAFR